MRLSQENGPNPIPSIGEVSGLYRAVLDYNKEHTGFSGQLIQAVRDAVRGNSIADTTESDMYGELQRIVSNPTLEQIGLEIGPLGSYTAFIDGEERASSITHLPVVKDVGRFTHFFAI